MASLASKFLGVRNGVASRVSRVVTQTKNVSSKSAAAAMTALSSKKGSMPLRSAIAPAPAAMLRTGAPCCASSAEADVVELQLKARTNPKLYHVHLLTCLARCDLAVTAPTSNRFQFFVS